MTTHFYNAKQASEFIKRVLEVRHKIIVRLHHNPTEKSLHMNLIEELGDNIPDNLVKTRTHHVKFTKRHYETFGFKFPKWSGEEGESINKEIIDVLPENSIIYFVMPDSIWTITRKDILEYNCLWYIKDVKPVYSVPLSALKEFYNQTGENSDPFGLYEVFL